MRIRDVAFWQGQRAEADDEFGHGFLDFVESWCDRAEEVLAREPNYGHHVTPLDALRRTLNPTEAERGVLPPGWTAQMLLVVAACWSHAGEYGADLLENMTTFEKKMCADMAAVASMANGNGVAGAGSGPDAVPNPS